MVCVHAAATHSRHGSPIVRHDPDKNEFVFSFAYERDFVSDIRKHGGSFEKGMSWNECTARLPADMTGAAFIDRFLAEGEGAPAPGCRRAP